MNETDMVMNSDC